MSNRQQCKLDYVILSPHIKVNKNSQTDIQLSKQVYENRHYKKIPSFMMIIVIKIMEITTTKITTKISTPILKV